MNTNNANGMRISGITFQSPLLEETSVSRRIAQYEMPNSTVATVAVCHDFSGEKLAYSQEQHNQPVFHKTILLSR
jgi:hypothetical protein